MSRIAAETTTKVHMRPSFFFQSGVRGDLFFLSFFRFRFVVSTFFHFYGFLYCTLFCSALYLWLILVILSFLLFFCLPGAFLLRLRFIVFPYTSSHVCDFIHPRFVFSPSSFSFFQCFFLLQSFFFMAVLLNFLLLFQLQHLIKFSFAFLNLVGFSLDFRSYFSGKRQFRQLNSLNCLFFYCSKCHSQSC